MHAFIAKLKLLFGENIARCGAKTNYRGIFVFLMIHFKIFNKVETNSIEISSNSMNFWNIEFKFNNDLMATVLSFKFI